LLWGCWALLLDVFVGFIGLFIALLQLLEHGLCMVFRGAHKQIF
jgi:hypothetical protein